MTRNSSETRQARYDSIYGRAEAAPGAAPLVPVDTAPRSIPRRVGRAILDGFKTAALAFGVVYVAGWFVVTLGTAFVSRMAMPSYRAFGTVERVLRYTPLRPYVLTPDPAITPDAAGVALEALAPPPLSANGFTQRVIGARADAPWRGFVYPKGYFEAAPPRFANVPDPGRILEAAAAGLSPVEMGILRTIATTPGWRQFDMVARAARVDMVGGRLVTPFQDDVAYWNMPVIRFAGPREFAQAGVSRAAWHLARGQLDSAEFALRAIVSVGFALQGNATTVNEELLGVIITGIGGDALARYYTITGDPRGAALAPLFKSGGLAPMPVAFGDLLLRDRARWRPALLRLANDPSTLPGFRYGALETLQLQTCANPRELAFGQGREVHDAFDAARADLARFPSERAVLDLMQGSLETDILRLSGTTDPGARVEAFVGRIYGNPRLATCMLAAFNWRTLQR